MSLRPAKCYTQPKRPYTRISRRVPKKSYVVGVPEPKIRQFQFGDSKAAFDMEVALVASRSVQIRHNALEAARTNANKYLADNALTYFFKIVPYPYHVMRENSMATGAGADRLQEGMRRSFGSPVGFAARVRAGQTLIIARVAKDKEAVAREALWRAAAKLPTPCTIEVKVLK
ncbi:MAG: 50S ribosomal protein L16 [Candidatus Aenigmatarchaeota archaeon]|nr:MAG: 50S ribosomal protein L16 [Candidatus Aenigmarchaeota archaeon]